MTKEIKHQCSFCISLWLALRQWQDKELCEVKKFFDEYWTDILDFKADTEVKYPDDLRDQCKQAAHKYLDETLDSLLDYGDFHYKAVEAFIGSDKFRSMTHEERVKYIHDDHPITDYKRESK